MIDCFTSFEWWKTEPHDEFVNNGAYCLAQPGQIYAVYLPDSGKVTVELEPGTYRGKWFNAFTGETVRLPQMVASMFTEAPQPRREPL